MNLERYNEYVFEIAEELAAMEQVVRPAMLVCSALPKAPRVSLNLLKVWTSLFVGEDLRPEHVEKAFCRHLGESPCFPAPAEIIEHARNIGRVVVGSVEESNQLLKALDERQEHLRQRKRVLEAVDGRAWGCN